MGTNFKNRTVYYSDISDSNSGIHGWGTEELFPIDKGSIIEKNSLSNITALEQIFDGVGMNRDMFDSLFDRYNTFIKTLLKNIETPVYLFHTDAFPEPPSKIRTYKGLVSKEINKHDYIQSEISLTNGYSTIAALICINDSNIDKCIELFPDRKTSCLVMTSDTSVFTHNFLTTLVNDYMSHQSANIINYLRVIRYFCPRRDMVCRIGGDGGDLEVSFQLFCNKDDKDWVANKFKTASELSNQ